MPDSSVERILFSSADMAVLDMVLDLVPELRACAEILKRVRSAHVSFPITSIDVLLRLTGQGIRIERFGIRPDDVKNYLGEEFFPIENEKELLGAVFMGFQRCRSAQQWLKEAPKHGRSLLEERDRAHSAPPNHN